MKYFNNPKKFLLIDFYILHIFNLLARYLPKFHKKYLFYFDVKQRYKRKTGKRLNYNSPSDLNEKLHWLARYWQHPLIVKCADKYLVREYVKECGCEGILIPLLGVYNNVNEIDFDSLPSKFVLKCNHGCGYNILCNDKAQFEKENAILQLDKWLSEDFGKETLESHYSKIIPKIICEHYLDFLNKISLIDYKIHCFNGAPEFFYVLSERDMNKRTIVLNSYSLKWERLSIVKDESKVDIPKPELLTEMIEYAKILSKPFPFVRVDLYFQNNKIYFGELTFTPECNSIIYFNDLALKDMGEKLKLPEKLLTTW